MALSRTIDDSGSKIRIGLGKKYQKSIPISTPDYVPSPVAFRRGMGKVYTPEAPVIQVIEAPKAELFRVGLTRRSTQSSDIPTPIESGLVFALYAKNDTGNTIDKTKSRTPWTNKLYNASSDGYSITYPNSLKSQNLTILTRVNVATNAGGKQYPDVLSAAKYDYTLSSYKLFGSWRMAMNFDIDVIAFYVVKNNTQVILASLYLSITRSNTYILVARINGSVVTFLNWKDGTIASATMSESIVWGNDYNKITIGYGEAPPYTANSYLNGYINFVYIWNRQVSNADIAKFILDAD